MVQREKRAAPIKSNSRARESGAGERGTRGGAKQQRRQIIKAHCQMKETKQREILKQTLHRCMYILYNYVHSVIVGVRPGQQGEAKSADG